MITTPTYHVFEMYKVHQDASLIEIDYQSPTYPLGEEEIPQFNISASRNDSGAINITACNIDPKNSLDISLDIRVRAILMYQLEFCLL